MVSGPADRRLRGARVVGGVGLRPTEPAGAVLSRGRRGGAPGLLRGGRLLPYFADPRLAVIQAPYAASGQRSRAAEAVLKGADTMGEAPCLGSNYVVRRTALRSIGGIGPDVFTRAGALRMAGALRADRWRTRYVTEEVTVWIGTSSLTSRLADRGRRAVVEMAAVGSAPRQRSRRQQPGATFHTTWVGLRHLGVVSLPAAAIA